MLFRLKVAVGASAVVLAVLLLSAVFGRVFPASLGAVAFVGAWSAARKAGRGQGGREAFWAIVAGGAVLTSVLVVLTWHVEIGDHVETELAALLGASAPFAWVLIQDHFETGRRSSLVTAAGIPLVIAAASGACWLFTASLEMWIVCATALSGFAAVALEDLSVTPLREHGYRGGTSGTEKAAASATEMPAPR